MSNNSQRPSHRAYVLSGGLVWTGTEFVRVDIRISGPEIVAVQAGLQLVASDDVVDCRDQLILPGLVNAHTHTHNVFARGLLDKGCLETLISVQPAVTHGRTPDETYAAARLNAIEMIRGGTTSCCDSLVMPPSIEHLDAAAQAYFDSGMRATVAADLADLHFDAAVAFGSASSPTGAVDRRPPSLSIRDAVDADRRWKTKSDGRVRIGLAPSVPLTSSHELLQSVNEASIADGLPVHTHLDESKMEALSSLRKFGRTTTRYLHESGLLSPSVILAHAVWVTSQDLELIAASGATVVHAPVSNLRLGSGVAPVAEMREAGIRVVLGTDGLGGSGNLSMLEAARMAAFVSRVRTWRQDRWLSSLDALEMATTGRAPVIPGPTRAGVIQPGYVADLMMISTKSLPLHPANAWGPQLVLGESGSGVVGVIVGGEQILRGGQMVEVDESAAIEAVDRAVLGLRRRNHELWDRADQRRAELDAAVAATSEVEPWDVSGNTLPTPFIGDSSKAR